MDVKEIRKMHKMLIDIEEVGYDPSNRDRAFSESECQGFLTRTEIRLQTYLAAGITIEDLIQAG